MYCLVDTFNERILSYHKSLVTASKAEGKFALAVKKANGESSYIPTQIRSIAKRAKNSVDLSETKYLSEDEEDYLRHIETE